jgi:integrase
MGNTRRNLSDACVRAAKGALTAHLAARHQNFDSLGKPKQASLRARFDFGSVSPNDLRRTYATWRRQHGTAPHLIGVAVGHTDSRMAERVYGRVPVESLGRLLAECLGD